MTWHRNDDAAFTVRIALSFSEDTPVCPVCHHPGCCCHCFGKTPRTDCPHVPQQR